MLPKAVRNAKSALHKESVKLSATKILRSIVMLWSKRANLCTIPIDKSAVPEDKRWASWLVLTFHPTNGRPTIPGWSRRKHHVKQSQHPEVDRQELVTTDRSFLRQQKTDIVAAAPPTPRHVVASSTPFLLLSSQLPIPLFIKTSLGPNACGLKYDGNPRIVDSRQHFASTVTGIRRAEPRQSSPEQQQQLTAQSSYPPIPVALGQQKWDTRRSIRGSTRTLRRSSLGARSRETLGETGWTFSDQHSELDLEVGMENDGPYSAYGDDRGGVGRPWANSEDVLYFLFKVVFGNALMVLDYLVAVR